MVGVTFLLSFCLAKAGRLHLFFPFWWVPFLCSSRWALLPCSLSDLLNLAGTILFFFFFFVPLSLFFLFFHFLFFFFLFSDGCYLCTPAQKLTFLILPHPHSRVSSSPGGEPLCMPGVPFFMSGNPAFATATKGTPLTAWLWRPGGLTFLVP